MGFIVGWVNVSESRVSTEWINADELNKKC